MSWGKVTPGWALAPTDRSGHSCGQEFKPKLRARQTLERSTNEHTPEPNPHPEETLSNDLIKAVGSLTFPWGRFDMTAPSVDGFVNVSGHATMEFDLRLRRA